MRLRGAWSGAGCGGAGAVRLVLALVILLAGCASDSPATLPTESSLPPAFLYRPLNLLLVPDQVGSYVTTAGYYYARGGETTLVDGLSFGGPGPPVPLAALPGQLWLADAPQASLRAALQQSGDLRYAPVLAVGRLEGPGAYGPGGRYPYQLVASRVTPLVAVSLTVPAILDKSFSYDGQFVRVRGTLLARPDSALLVDRVRPGGVPPANSRQVKLEQPFRDQALLQRLTGTVGGAARYGPVQVEGFWKGGVLIPLAIVPQ